MHSLVFVGAGVLAVLAAIGAVTRMNPIYSALLTALALGGVAVDMLVLHSPFLAAMQVLLYAGAIMVLFVFVIMLLSLKKEELGQEAPGASKGFALVVALAVFVLLAWPAWSWKGRGGLAKAPVARAEAAWPRVNPNTQQPGLGLETWALAEPSTFGSVEHIANALYSEGLVPFELVSVLLTAALGGVVILARKKFDEASIHPPAQRGVADSAGMIAPAHDQHLVKEGAH
jgi:NADH-quinone oxidoreductase subunit J